MKRTLHSITLSVAVALSACSGDAPHRLAATSETYGEQLGTVQIDASCSDEATRRLAEGLALWHHMTYDGAEKAFKAAVEVDSECALGYWGQAMSIVHPIWSDRPDPETFERGRALIEGAKTRGERNEIEEAWINAVEAYYAEGRGNSEMPNLRQFAAAWSAVAERFPKDPEARAISALTHLSEVNPNDKTYARQREAGEIAESVLEMIPDHPGGHHYAIHAYDYPPLAERAREIAQSYGSIAPEVSHALHMPGHIVTRLGLWEESIDWNGRSADAALAHPEDASSKMHYMHALDYLAYAYLQAGEFDKAEDVAQTVAEIGPPFRSSQAMAYTLAAVPARMALERQQWDVAAELQPRTPTDFPWDGFTAVESITWFAKALGNTRGEDRDIASAQSEIQNLETLRDQTPGTYWKTQIEIQRLSATAWLHFTEGNENEALDAMREAAERERSTEKPPVSPGPVLPAEELLGDLFMEMGRFDEAMEAYEASLERSPNRLNSLQGARRAMERAGTAEESSG